MDNHNIIKKAHTRRSVLRIVGLLLLLPLLKALRNLLGFKTRVAAAQGQAIVAEKPDKDGVYFHGKVILVKQESKLKAMSAKCPHLGCTINQEKDGLLLCPCHGSSYDLEGKLQSGPAETDLKELNFTVSDDGTQVEVENSK